jgi:hypothetical protein
MRGGVLLLPVALVTLSLCATGSGCGEESQGSANAPAEATASDRGREATTSDRGRGRRVIRRTFRRARRQATDGGAVETCRYITPEGQARAIQAYGLRYAKELKSCPQMVRFARKVEAPYLRDARRTTVRRIKLRGVRASVQVEGPRGEPLPGDKRGYGGIVDLELRKIDSRWLVDDTSFVPYGTGE